MTSPSDTETARRIAQLRRDIARLEGYEARQVARFGRPCHAWDEELAVLAMELRAREAGA